MPRIDDIQEASRLESQAMKRKLLVETEFIRLQQGPERRREAVYDRREVFFGQVVDDESVGMAIDTLRDYQAESDEPITLYLNSPGGDVFDGFLLFDYVQELRDLGIEFTTRVKGLAASMGSVLAQAGDHRVISSNSWYMVHEPSTLFIGKAGDIKREAKLMEALHKQLCAILAERSNLSQAEIVRRSSDKDWWLTAEEARGFGFFDEVA